MTDTIDQTFRGRTATQPPVSTRGASLGDLPKVAATDRELNRLPKAPLGPDPRTSRSAWAALVETAIPNEVLSIDFSHVEIVDRTQIAEIIRFLRLAERRGIAVAFARLNPATEAMLELLGIHHLVDFSNDL